MTPPREWLLPLLALLALLLLGWILVAAPPPATLPPGGVVPTYPYRIPYHSPTPTPALWRTP